MPEVLKSEVAWQIQELLDLGFTEPSNTKGQDDENEAQMCRDNWCCSQCIRAVAYSHAICHRMPGSYNACGITVESSDSDLHGYQSLCDTLKVGLFILVSMAIIIFGAHSQFLSFSVSHQKAPNSPDGPLACRNLIFFGNIGQVPRTRQLTVCLG